MNATIKVKADLSQLSPVETIIRLENGCTVHIISGRAVCYAPGGYAIANELMSRYNAITCVLKAGLEWSPPRSTP